MSLQWMERRGYLALCTSSEKNVAERMKLGINAVGQENCRGHWRAAECV